MENKKVSVLCASLMAGEGVVNGFTEKMKEVFTGGYYTLNPGHPNFNKELIRMTLEHKPDIVFLQIQAPHIITEETAKEIAKHSFVMNWSGDIRQESPPKWYLDIGQHIQLSTFSNMADVRSCLAKGVAADWLECGFNPEIYKKHDNPRVTPEIVAHFNDYGTHAFPLSQYRIDIVNALRAEFGNRFGVFGNFPGALTNFNSDQLEESRNYAGAKIAINCSHFCVEKYSSDRLSRIMGTGGAVCLSHYFPGIRDMYEVGNHLHIFENIPDLLTLCRNLLANPIERERCAAAGQRHALGNYTFLKMAENIKNLYLKHK